VQKVAPAEADARLSARGFHKSNGPRRAKVLRPLTCWAALNKSRGLTDDEINAWTDRADAILADAVDLPVQTEASARAVIDLALDEPSLGGHQWFGEKFTALVRTARACIASGARLNRSART
jgi:hypothetical protein